MRNVEADFDRRWGAAARELISHKASFLAGDYWDVWVHVYYANALLHREGSPRQVFGLARRFPPTRPLWPTPLNEHDMVALFADKGVSDADVGYLKRYKAPRWNTDPAEVGDLLLYYTLLPQRNGQ